LNYSAEQDPAKSTDSTTTAMVMYCQYYHTTNTNCLVSIVYRTNS